MAVGFDDACGLVDAALEGRPQIVLEAAAARDLKSALQRLRAGMDVHLWKIGSRRINLDRAIESYDAQTRQEGFHAMHDWDGPAVRVNERTIPVDVLDYIIDRRGAEAPHAPTLAIVLDYYFLYVLALFSLRVWDEGQPNAHVDRLDALLHALQGPGGSGHRFVDNAPTLMLLATSHYEPEEHGYEILLDRVRALDSAHQTTVALGHAASMGCHLRFGFESTYGKDLVFQRDDNVADYPWLYYAVATLMGEYARLRDAGIEGPAREAVVEALLGGMTADPGAFTARPSSAADRTPGAIRDRKVWITAFDRDRPAFHDRFEQYREDLLGDFERYRPSESTYSPISLLCNFSFNVLKGMVVDALLWGEPRQVSLNDLFTSLPQPDPKARAKETVAKTLMGYARANPDRIRGRLMPVIVYDPWAGRRAFGATVRAIKEPGPSRRVRSAEP